MASDPDFKSREYILRNLAFLDDVLSDETGIIDAREDIAESIVEQTCFYMYCLLALLLKGEESKMAIPQQQQDLVPIEGFWCKRRRRKHKPCVLIFGPSGYLGRRILHSLESCGLGEFLMPWDRKNYKRKKAMHSSGPDIIINAANLSSFTTLSRELVEHTFPHAAFISCSAGVQRRRYYFIFKTVTVFRTYAEPTSYGATIATPPKQPPSAEAMVRHHPEELVYKRNQGTHGLLKVLANYYHTNAFEADVDECVKQVVSVLNEPLAGDSADPEADPTTRTASGGSVHTHSTATGSSSAQRIRWHQELQEGIRCLYENFAFPFCKEFGGFYVDAAELFDGTEWSQMPAEERSENLMEDEDVMDVFGLDNVDPNQSDILTQILSEEDAIALEGQKEAAAAAEARLASMAEGGGF